MSTVKLVEPLSPKDIIDNLINIIPATVITAVNNLLKLKFRGGEVILKQKDIIDEIIRLDNNLTSEEIFDKKWMDFDELYRKDWFVTYVKPAYSESFDAYFAFSEKK
jgi:hypothetical protein